MLTIELRLKDSSQRTTPKKRLIKEGILIKINHDHVVNGNEGYEAADIWNLFSHTIMRDISM
ncbi:MAG: hypothetical protein GY820_05585 [Gammaproteobacteria bacterium]|nr:hypothetical protein [Gammaproteobacteria bacterium]